MRPAVIFSLLSPNYFTLFLFLPIYCCLHECFTLVCLFFLSYLVKHLVTSVLESCYNNEWYFVESQGEGNVT